ncbi:type VI secretion system contractile sheath protein TssC [Bacteroides fragilis]|uniref:Type VI secretion system contractile sheath protein TssC n=1 Tax=Bacteroides fragilis TaxID=817 RepID=A0A396BPJ3_BACFG|nr:type VI secretion system contractile sheath protein TssC [Bacteroides fragilis]RHH07913.1 type VI secretion system contractile sheath protein TssC [Bacteroides fragilis]
MEKQNIKPGKAMENEVLQMDKNVASDRYEIAMQRLAGFGGFSFLESAIEELANLNPERDVRKEMFLKEDGKAKERQNLLKKLELWIEILSSSDNTADMLEKCQERSDIISENLKKNQLAAVTSIAELEKSYRSVMLFFENAEEEKLRNIVFMNASNEQLRDLDNPRFINEVAEELKNNFDRLDLRNNYSMLVLPGYLGSNMIVEKWMKICDQNKVMLLTDFMDLDKKDDVVDLFTSANLTGGEIHRTHAMMCCNWPVGRGKYSKIGETKDLRVSPAAALAGQMYNQKLSQVSSGKKYGGINGTDGVAFSLRKSEVSMLESMGLIPFVYEYSKVMAFSDRTLYSGSDIGLQTYSVVRTADYIFKVLCDFVNRRAFESWNTQSAKEQRREITEFLDSMKGPKNDIEDFEIVLFEQDRTSKRIYLYYRIKFFYPGKTYIMKMDGMEGDDKTMAWKSEFFEE